MKKNHVQVSFDEAAGMYRAEERLANGPCGAFGATPEDARARLGFARTLERGCRLSREEGLEADHERLPTDDDSRID